MVTGAGRGIGFEIARLLVAEGAKVVVNDLGGGSAGGGADISVAQHAVDQLRAAGGEARVHVFPGGHEWSEAVVEALAGVLGEFEQA